MKEIWKKIEGYPDYKISNFGRVISNKHKEERLLKPGPDNNKYLTVNLCKNGKPKNHRIHRLVALAFIPNPQNKPCVNHIDETRQNNHIDNLEWCTYLENNIHGTCIQRTVLTQSIPVNQLSIDGQLIMRWPSIREASRNGFHGGHICDCAKGRIKTHKGFKWEYATTV